MKPMILGRENVETEKEVYFELIQYSEDVVIVVAHTNPGSTVERIKNILELKSDGTFSRCSYASMEGITTDMDCSSRIKESRESE